MARGEGGGRPSALQKRTIERITNAVRLRNIAEAAGEMAGVPRDTLFMWLRQGRQLADRLEDGDITRSELTAHQRRLVTLSQEITRANAEAHTGTIAMIGMAGTSPTQRTIEKTRMVGQREDGTPIYATETTTITEPPDWRALAWIAERRWREDWAKTTRQEHSGPGGGAIPLEHRIDQLLDKADALRKRTQPAGELANPQPIIDVEAQNP